MQHDLFCVQKTKYIYTRFISLENTQTNTHKILTVFIQLSGILRCGNSFLFTCFYSHTSRFCFGAFFLNRFWCFVQFGVLFVCLLCWVLWHTGSLLPCSACFSLWLQGLGATLWFRLPGLLTVVPPPVVEHGFQAAQAKQLRTTGLVSLQHVRSSFPEKGSNPCPLGWQANC